MGHNLIYMLEKRIKTKGGKMSNFNHGHKPGGESRIGRYEPSKNAKTCPGPIQNFHENCATFGQARYMYVYRKTYCYLYRTALQQ